MARRPAWKNDRITNAVDEETGLRVVRLPNVVGMTTSDRDALFAFERPILGTLRATIRMNKRAAGTDVPVPAKIVAAGIPTELAHLYES